jgi:hypothetical protein
MLDLPEVCPLSREGMFHLLSKPLQSGIRFLRHPLPALPTVFLAVDLPVRAAIRAYRVPYRLREGVRFRLYPGGLNVSVSAEKKKTDNRPRYLLVQACQQSFGLFLVTGLVAIHLC